jgi:hypothetical protein
MKRWRWRSNFQECLVDLSCLVMSWVELVHWVTPLEVESNLEHHHFLFQKVVRRWKLNFLEFFIIFEGVCSGLGTRMRIRTTLPYASINFAWNSGHLIELASGYCSYNWVSVTNTVRDRHGCFLPLQNMNTAQCNRKFENFKFEEDELMSFEMMLK